MGFFFKGLSQITPSHQIPSHAIKRWMVLAKISLETDTFICSPPVLPHPTPTLLLLPGEVYLITCPGVSKFFCEALLPEDKCMGSSSART